MDWLLYIGSTYPLDRDYLYSQTMAIEAES